MFLHVSDTVSAVNHRRSDYPFGVRGIAFLIGLAEACNFKP